jgi:hypothetical protein
MTKDIFSNDQERQILKAFDDIDADIGIDKLDDEKGLQNILHSYETGTPKSRVNLGNLLGLRWLVSLGGALATPSYVIASILIIFGLTSMTVFQSQQLHVASSKNISEVLRGNPEIVLVVNDPMNEARDLSNQFSVAGIAHKIDIQSKDKILLDFPVNDITIQIMTKKRVELPINERCIIVFEKAT